MTRKKKEECYESEILSMNEKLIKEKGQELFKKTKERTRRRE
jgi:hypothetical protein